MVLTKTLLVRLRSVQQRNPVACIGRSSAPVDRRRKRAAALESQARRRAAAAKLKTVFSPDLCEGPGFGLIAGGVGITPTMSILRTLADRDDQRPIVAFVASQTWEDVTFRDELEMHAQRPSVTLVHTVDDPPEGWTGETGHINEAMLRRHLPVRHQRWRFFICGPNPMMDAMEEALLDLEVPASRIHTERFGWV
jgi:ferredoxin-NADP reductase